MSKAVSSPRSNSSGMGLETVTGSLSGLSPAETEGGAAAIAEMLIACVGGDGWEAHHGKFCGIVNLGTLASLA